MILKVTAEHIANGIPDSSTSCPIALAVKEQIPCVDPCSVCIEDYIYFGTEDGLYYSFGARGAVSDFIERFDKNREQPPQDFDLGDLSLGLLDHDY